MNIKEVFIGSILEDDLLLLDGKTKTESLIEKINKIKAERNIQKTIIELGNDKFSEFISKIINYGLTNGQINLNSGSGYSCDICNARGSYPLYKAGPNKGKENRNKKFKSLYVYKYTGAGEVCYDCNKEILLKLKETLENNHEKMKFFWSKWIYEKRYWTKHYKYHCKNCNKDSWEENVKWLPALMGGYYRGKCPNCGFENLPFGGHLIEPTKEWKVIPWYDDNHSKR